MISQAPEFFSQAPTVKVYDPLAQFLGASADGFITYQYSDAVALAGHSCPTVASAYLMTRLALKALYPNEIPVRGHIAIEWQGQRGEGVTGVMANVASLLTGAADEAGFKGIAGNFQRSERLDFGEAMAGEVRFIRLDNGKAVEVSADLSSVPMAPEVRELMPVCISGQASEAQLRAFGAGWQERVRKILIEHPEDAAIFQVREV